MRNMPNFTMRKDGVLPRGDWFIFKNETETPKIYIYDEIGFWGTEASVFVDVLNGIDAKKLELHINSPGGEVFDGLAIYNAVKQHKAHVTVYIDGLAASAASYIAQAGDEVVMARNAQMMIHDASAYAYGNQADHLSIAEQLGVISDNIADIYAFRAGKRGFDTTKQEYRDLMSAEVWFTGKEAVEAGLADSVTDSDDEAADVAKNTWDLSFYNFAGREQAESPLRVREKIRLENRQKEKNMGDKPKNSEAPVETPVEEVPPVETPVEAPVEETPAPPVEAPVSNRVQGMMINGQMVTDQAVIQNHITSLENAQRENEITHRKSFIENLAKGNKIPASQIDSLVELVNGKDSRPGMSADQFAAFQASYESTPASNLFGNYGADTTSQAAPGGATGSGVQDRIAVLQGTVAMQSRTMSPEDAKKTPSYLELQDLLKTQSTES